MQSRPPLIPPSTNSDNSYSRTLETSSLTVKDQAAFFGSSIVSQQTVYPNIKSILIALQRFGLATPGYYQEAGPLVGTDPVGASKQGFAVALSTDGNTLAVGGPNDDEDSSIGAVWVFVKTNDVWIQQGSKLVGSDATVLASQGCSVSLSGDGNTLAFGGYFDNVYNGSTWVFTRTDGVWTQQGSKLAGSDSVGPAGQGGSVSLSADGNTLASGGSNDDTGIGAVWIFTRTDGTWAQQGPKLVGTGAEGLAYQGFSVSLSSDGNTLAVGGSGDDDYVGATWIFTRTDDTWTQQGSKLVGTGYIGQSFQGSSVSLGGNTIIVGGSGNNGGIGAIWVFNRSGTTWTQTGNKLVGTGYTGAYIQQGVSVSLSNDEQIFITAGITDNDIGAAWVFKLINGIWTQYGSKLVPTGYTTDPYFGAVAISGDSSTIAIGGQGNDSFIGATWIYVGQ